MSKAGSIVYRRPPVWVCWPHPVPPVGAGGQRSLTPERSGRIRSAARAPLSTACWSAVVNCEPKPLLASPNGTTSTRIALLFLATCTLGVGGLEVDENVIDFVPVTPVAV